MISISSRATEQIVRRTDESLLMVTINEYPKSGGTWLARLVSSATGLPFIDNSRLPVLAPSVVRTHWKPSDRLAPMIYIVRDPRDVMVSWFHHRAKHLDRPSLHKRYVEPIDPNRVVETLPEFMRLEFEKPGAGVALNWTDHARLGVEAARDNERCALVRYEDLLIDAEGVLTSALQAVLGSAPAPSTIEAAVASHSLDNTRARDQLLDVGQRSFARAGQAGRWQDCWSPEAERVLRSFAGELPLELGYE